MKTIKSAAFGVRAHSGWAAVVVIAGSIRAPELLDRRRIVLVDQSEATPNVPGRGPEQPYHVAKELRPEEAEQYLARSANNACKLALAALQVVEKAVRERSFRIAGCGIVMASGRPLPILEQILVSHPMIHTAEGEFFRNAVCEACLEMGIAVFGVRESDLLHLAEEKLSLPATKIKGQIEGLRRRVGSPWTADQKNAAVAGLLALYFAHRHSK